MTTSKTGPSYGGSVSTEQLECLSLVRNMTKRSSYSWISTSSTYANAHQVPSLPSTSLAGERGQGQSHGQAPLDRSRDERRISEPFLRGRCPLVVVTAARSVFSPLERRSWAARSLQRVRVSLSRSVSERTTDGAPEQPNRCDFGKRVKVTGRYSNLCDQGERLRDSSKWCLRALRE